MRTSAIIFDPPSEASPPRRAHRAPPACRRYDPRPFVVGACCGACIAMLVGAMLNGGARTGSMALAGLLFLGGLAASILLESAEKRFIEELVGADYQRCLQCGYDLKGLPRRHHCPECGRRFDADRVKRVWRRYLASLPNPYILRLGSHRLR